jgi:hypothetical protein
MCLKLHLYLTEARKGHRYAIANLNLEWYFSKADTFLCHVIAINKTFAWAYEPGLKWTFSEWYHPGFAHLRNLPGTQQCDYDIDGVFFHHNVA